VAKTRISHPLIFFLLSSCLLSYPDILASYHTVTYLQIEVFYANGQIKKILNTLVVLSVLSISSITPIFKQKITLTSVS
jgi:hypothetical protein